MKKQALATNDVVPETAVERDSQSVNTIRIYVSSLSDIHNERERAKLEIKGLRRRCAGRFLLEPLLWEDIFLSADKSFLGGIDSVLSDKQGVDIAVFILRSRFGSPIGPTIYRLDGLTCQISLLFTL